MKKISVILIMVIFIIVSCKKEQDVNLLYGKWEFECFDKKTMGCKEYPPDDLKKMTTEFFADGKCAIDGQCNGCSAAFESQSNGNFNITLLICTELMCDGIEWEERLHNALQNSKEFIVTNKKLKIYFENDDKKNIMVFKKQ